MNYVWCSLFDHHTDVLDVVSFRYDRPVRVADNAKIQLWKDDSELVKEADAYLDTSVNCWMVSADFGGFEMLPGAGYSLVIPAGTVISDTEIGVENPKSEFIVKGSGINEIDSGAGAVYDVYDLSGRKVESAEPGQIYIINGRKIILK